MRTSFIGPAGDHRLRRSLLFALLALAWMGAIFWASSGPVPPLVPDPLVDLVAKKVGHFMAYALLAVLWWLAFRWELTDRAAIAIALAITIGYAGFDEIHQAFTATRNPSIVDVAIDTAGAVIGLWAIVRWSGRRP